VGIINEKWKSSGSIDLKEVGIINEKLKSSGRINLKEVSTIVLDKPEDTLLSITTAGQEFETCVLQPIWPDPALNCTVLIQ
jgi:hypothetical protein